MSMIVAGARPETHATELRHGGTALPAGEAADSVWKGLNQLFEPGFGIPQYRLTVADQEDVEVQIQELAQVTPKARRIIHDTFGQESALARRVADDGVPDDQDDPVRPQQGDLARRLSGGVDHLKRPERAADFQPVVQFRLLVSGVVRVVGVDRRPRAGARPHPVRRAGMIAVVRIIRATPSCAMASRSSSVGSTGSIQMLPSG